VRSALSFSEIGKQLRWMVIPSAEVFVNSYFISELGKLYFKYSRLDFVWYSSQNLGHSTQYT
jgi:hypothetical protein